MIAIKTESEPALWFSTEPDPDRSARDRCLSDIVDGHAAILGVDRLPAETDDELRARIRELHRRPMGGSLESIRAAILSVPDTISCHITQEVDPHAARTRVIIDVTTEPLTDPVWTRNRLLAVARDAIAAGVRYTVHIFERRGL